MSETMGLFEGREKRLEVSFGINAAELLPTQSLDGNLRSITRSQLDALLDDAMCKIISVKSTDHFDAYVLSESSLFVYAKRLILKTCGTTHLLAAVPRLLKLASDLSLRPLYVKYSRASYLFPDMQPAEHSSFTEEVSTLKHYFEGIRKSCNSYVLGDHCKGLQWHVFVAGIEPPDISCMTLEICMTGLSARAASRFIKHNGSYTATDVTEKSDIVHLLPGADIDSILFWPCGYSMNGLLGEGYLTIHVTPEEECSFASVEFSGFHSRSLRLDRVMNLVVKIFEPESLYVAATVGKDPNVSLTSEDYGPIKNYVCHGLSIQKCPNGTRVVFGCFEAYSGSSIASSFSNLESLCTSDASDEEVEIGLGTLSQNKLSMERQLNLITLKEVYHIHSIRKNTPASIDECAKAMIHRFGLEDTFYIFDLSIVWKLYQLWRQNLPRVRPYYAVKCNPDPAMINLLSNLGSGFDCASESEARLVLSLGVEPERIVFASSCKRPRDIQYIRSTGINLTTFDTPAELKKLHKLYPECKLLLRIRADDSRARCQLGNKYGAEMETVEGLLALASSLDLNVVGISFHVGSSAEDSMAFANAIYLAHAAFQQGLAYGFPMEILDIGGGFPDGLAQSDSLAEMEKMINKSLAKHFPDKESVSIIAEPGRYFAEAAATLLVSVFGRRDLVNEDGQKEIDYWITDGLYGSFNCIPYDHATVTPRPVKLSKQKHEGPLWSSTLFGPTCDGLDVVATGCELPELDLVDWVAFSNMGAYTIAGASNFNGINASDVDMFYVWSEE